MLVRLAMAVRLLVWGRGRRRRRRERRRRRRWQRRRRRRRPLLVVERLRLSLRLLPKSVVMRRRLERLEELHGAAIVVGGARRGLAASPSTG